MKGQPVSCFDKAVQLLALRPHFSAELRSKLTKRGFAREAVEQALGRLGDLGYLDEPRTAREFVRERRRNRGFGLARLRSELQRRRVDSAVIDEVLAELDGEEERRLAQTAAERWARGRGITADELGSDLEERSKASLVRHLQRKGFSQGVILDLLSS